MNYIQNQTWQKLLQSEMEQDSFKELMLLVEEEYKNYTCFPPKDKIFNAFNQCDFDNVKVVILGQDPYHGEGEANGLCFSVNDGIAIPPSLKNIFLEINANFDQLFLPTSGNLEFWARQGVLLLNATLTVRKDLANSHKHLHWQNFTDNVIKLIASEKENLVFMLWGNFAQKKSKFIDENKHLVLKSGHPSPLSAIQKKWFGNQHFKLANEYLKEKGKTEISWY